MDIWGQWSVKRNEKVDSASVTILGQLATLRNRKKKHRLLQNHSVGNCEQIQTVPLQDVYVKVLVGLTEN